MLLGVCVKTQYSCVFPVCLCVCVCVGSVYVYVCVCVCVCVSNHAVVVITVVYPEVSISCESKPWVSVLCPG